MIYFDQSHPPILLLLPPFCPHPSALCPKTAKSLSLIFAAHVLWVGIHPQKHGQ